MGHGARLAATAAAAADTATTTMPTVAEIEALVEQRDAARERRDYADADAIRDKLATLGVRVQDGGGGKLTPEPAWERVDERNDRKAKAKAQAKAKAGAEAAADVGAGGAEKGRYRYGPALHMPRIKDARSREEVER